jgi:purine-binding chemotaxis protein CheW
MSEPRWDELARSAAEPAEEAVNEELQQLLTLRVAGSLYAVPVDRVREIVRIRPITPIPRVREDVRGVISLRGDILQVVDLRRRLSLDAQEPTRSTRIVVLQFDEDQLAGLIVDAVDEVLRVPGREIVPVSGQETVAVEALCRRGDVFVSLLDLTRVMGSEHA